MTKHLVIGADIGGTHITAALVDLEQKAILPHSSIRIQVDSHASYQDVLEIWSQAITQAKQGYDMDKVSLAMPGPFDYEKGICLIKDQNKYENLYGLNIKELLSVKLKNRPDDISMINDAAAFLQGEVFGGAASGFNKAIGITLGTGLGSCIYRDNVSLSADKWSMPFKAGIAEDYLSTRWFLKRYTEVSGGKAAGVKALSDLAEHNNDVKSIFIEFGSNLAEFLNEFMSLSSPEVVVLGGNIARGFRHFKEPLLAGISQQFPEVVIKTAALGEQAALLGAASYWNGKDISLQNNY